MLFAVEVGDDWLLTLSGLAGTILNNASTTPEDALERAVFSQIHRQNPLSQGGTIVSQPVITFRHGACSASVFENEYQRDDETFTVRTVSFQRRYLDKEGVWQTTNSLKIHDIPKAVLVLNKCYEFLTSNAGQDEEEI